MKAIICFTIFLGSAAHADHAAIGFGSGTASSITTFSARTIPEGKWIIGTRIEYLDLDRFSDAELVEFSLAGEEVHSTDKLISPFLIIGYGITDAFTLSARLPYVSRSNIREGEDVMGTPEVHNDGNPAGIGDASLFGHYLLNNGSTGNWKLAVVGGAKVPTGKTDWTNDDGETLEPEHQPGSGSWDFVGGVAITTAASMVAIDASLLYTLVNEGEADVDLGDFVNYSLSFAYRLGESKEHLHDDGSTHLHDESQVSFDLILEGNGEWRTKEKHDGVNEESSGGSLVFISPGLRVSGITGWSAYVSLGLPIAENLNGLQHEEGLRLITGISFLL